MMGLQFRPYDGATLKHQITKVIRFVIVTILATGIVFGVVGYFAGPAIDVSRESKLVIAISIWSSGVVIAFIDLRQQSRESKSAGL